MQVMKSRGCGIETSIVCQHLQVTMCCLFPYAIVMYMTQSLLLPAWDALLYTQCEVNGIVCTGHSSATQVGEYRLPWKIMQSGITVKVHEKT